MNRAFQRGELFEATESLREKKNKEPIDIEAERKIQLQPRELQISNSNLLVHFVLIYSHFTCRHRYTSSLLLLLLFYFIASLLFSIEWILEKIEIVRVDKRLVFREKLWLLKKERKKERKRKQWRKTDEEKHRNNDQKIIEMKVRK